MAIFGVLLWLLPIVLIGQLGREMSLAAGLAITVLAAYPLWITYGYGSAVQREHNLSAFIHPKWWHHGFEGHLLRLPVLLVISLWFGIEVMVDVGQSGLKGAAWIGFAATLGTVLNIGFNGLMTNYVSLQRAYRAIQYSAYLAGPATALLVVSVNRSGPSAEVDYSGSSQLLKEMFATVGIWETTQNALAQYLPFWGTVVLSFLSGTAYYFLVVRAAGGVALIAKGDWRRIFVHGRELPNAVPPTKLFMTALVATLVTLFFVGLAAATEDYLQKLYENQGQERHTETAVFPTRPSEIRAALKLEGVGGLMCRMGTVQALKAADEEFTAAMNTHEAEISVQIDTIFLGMRERVPAFLNWYYSLTADYLRTAHLLIGDGSGYIERQLNERLTAPGSNNSIVAIMGQLDAVRTVFTEKRVAALSACRTPQAAASEWGNGPIEIVARYNASDAMDALSQLETIMAGETHFGLRASAGGLAGAAAGVVIAKFGVSTSAKLAAKALVKLAGKKATGLLTGVIAGGAMGGVGGSTVPGLGTGVGAVVGGIVGGVAVWVGVDFLAIKLEEEVSRSTFNADLLAAIDASEAEVRRTLLGQ